MSREEFWREYRENIKKCSVREIELILRGIEQLSLEIQFVSEKLEDNAENFVRSEKERRHLDEIMENPIGQLNKLMSEIEKRKSKKTNNE